MSGCMTADLLAQSDRDLGGDRRHLRRLDATRSLDGNLELSGDTSGSARQHHDPIAETGGFAHVVGHEQHREPLLGGDALDLVVQYVSRDGVERAERFVHQ